MYLRRIKPFRYEIFNRTIGDSVGSDHTLNQPALNVVELNEHYEISLAAPGLEKENFSVKVEKDYLIVSSEKINSNNDNEKGKYTRREFNYETFSRRFYLPKTVNREEISAEYTNGILVITLNKKEEAKEKEAMQIAIS
ncbi:Hsp20/alpha crystallin family protein [Portibacter marinus]|uniref:Hsp20/alpha crystallin family protein n=1 Tax=Portibacter marinus TaxID=2898660 RepID=UPI001F49096C|nr:Hsp20/alpha crystallin family protein [Portibacter marinus]